MPARKTKLGAQRCVIQRVKYIMPEAVAAFGRVAVVAGEIIARVIERHQHHHQPAQEIDRLDPHPRLGPHFLGRGRHDQALYHARDRAVDDCEPTNPDALPETNPVLAQRLLNTVQSSEATSYYT